MTPAPGPGNLAGFQLTRHGTCMKNGRLGLRHTDLLQSAQIQSESNSHMKTNSIFQHLGMCYEILSGHFKLVHVLAGLAQARRRLGLAVCELAVFPW